MRLVKMHFCRYIDCTDNVKRLRSNFDTASFTCNVTNRNNNYKKTRCGKAQKREISIPTKIVVGEN